MSIFFTSDTHYGHSNIISYCNRPFSSVEEMDQAMIDRWNSVVTPQDRVFHLGDFAMGPNLKERVKSIRAKLVGSITLILGNHDRSRSFYLDAGFDHVHRCWCGQVDGHTVLLKHHPPIKGDYEGEYTIRLCGHVHEKWVKKDGVINVGVDQWDFTPRQLSELIY